MKKKGFTLIELLVVIAIIAMLLAILMPALGKVKKIAMRVVCGTNLKGLGTAQMVYANDYDSEYTVQGRGGAHTWGDFTANWQDPAKLWSTAGNITVGASLYMLVREADVNPKSFVCPSGGERVYDGKNPNNLDLTQIWDFASPTYPTAGVNGAANCVSYSYHQPYAAGQTNPAPASTGSKGKYSADGSRSASFAVMADKNPWFDAKLTTGGVIDAKTYLSKVFKLGNNLATEGNIDNGLEKYTIQIANAQPHDRDGQNILFGDGHSSYENRPDVGIKNDNVYVMRDAANASIGARTGLNLTDKNTRTAPVNLEDSVLVNDGAVVVTGP